MYFFGDNVHFVNGSPMSEIRLSWGIRQENPLSSFLFLMVAEGLNVEVKEARDIGAF